MSSIISIGTAVPGHEYNQADLAGFMSGQLSLSETAARKIRVLYKSTHINTRYSVLPDFKEGGEKKLFINGLNNVPTLEERMQVFNKEALPLAVRAIDDCLKNITKKVSLKDITHIITVSCTGLTAPGLEIELMERLQLRDDICRFPVNFIGCYAAFPALKMADAICKTDGGAKVLVVCVELCTLHFQRETDDDNLLANSLFADGAAAAVITSDEAAVKFKKSLRLDSFSSCVMHKGNRDMAWRLSSRGFLMTLSSYIPNLVNEGILPLIQKTLGTLSIDKDDIAHWALHPGGKKILDVCADVLNLPKEKLKPSYDILSRYGNMSAATVLFVLKEIWENGPNNNEKVFAAGFGPGLTLEAAAMTVNSTTYKVISAKREELVTT